MAHDATELELPAASFDVVFSNWLLMYLSDAEVSKLAADALRWVRLTLAWATLCSVHGNTGMGSAVTGYQVHRSQQQRHASLH